MSWRKIKSAPKDGSRVAVLDMSTEHFAFYGTGFFNDITGKWDIDAETWMEFTPTHWFPLPEPPKPE